MGSKDRALRNTVGRQVFKYIVAISIAFIALSSAILFVVEYGMKKAVVKREVADLGASHAAGVAEGLWNLDADILLALVDGIDNYPYVNYVLIEDQRGPVASKGASNARSVALIIPVVRELSGGETSRLGVLRLEIDSGKIMREVSMQTLPTIVLEVLFLLVESLIVLAFFSRMSTRHLSRIAAYIGKYDVRADAPPLKLDKKERGDELDLLVQTYNGMREDVSVSREAEKRAMENLERSLREKEVFIQEIYHRTNNNMQLITSFLSLAAGDSCDERIDSVLNDTVRRIASMALAHEKLLASEDLSRIDLGGYITDLVLSIKDAYFGELGGIEISVEVEPGIIGLIDLAVPCGLVLNELVVNSIKHAFAGRESGAVKVTLMRSSANTLELSVSDDGIGLPAGFDFRRDGHIGLQMVVSIVELQLNGHFTLASGMGTRCTAIVRDDIFGSRV